jgi:hypothetical protein
MMKRWLVAPGSEMICSILDNEWSGSEHVVQFKPSFHENLQ